MAKWYAVLKNSEDKWGNGSFDLAEAKEMLKGMLNEYPDALIAVISEDNDDHTPKWCEIEIPDKPKEVGNYDEQR